MKIAKLLLVGLFLLVLALSSMACADIIPKAKKPPAAPAPAQLSTGNQSSTHYYRFFR